MLREKTASRFSKYIATEKDFYKRVFLLIIPIVIQSIINQCVNMMDTVMVGRLDAVSISASSLANQFYQVFHMAHFPP